MSLSFTDLHTIFICYYFSYGNIVVVKYESAISIFQCTTITFVAFAIEVCNHGPAFSFPVFLFSPELGIGIILSANTMDLTILKRHFIFDPSFFIIFFQKTVALFIYHRFFGFQGIVPEVGAKQIT